MRYGSSLAHSLTRSLALVMLCALAASSASAQIDDDDEQLAGCAQYGAQDFEIGVRVDTPFFAGAYFVRVYNVATGTLVDQRDIAMPGSAPHIATGCGWVAHVGETNNGANRVILDDDTLYRIEIWYLDDFPLRLAAYEYYLDLGNLVPASTSFYASRVASDGYPDLLFLVSNQTVRVYPTRLGGGGAGRDVDDFFSDSNWILPYDLPTICATTGCNSEADNDWPFLTPSRTDAFGFPREYATTAGADWRVPAGRSYTWSGSEISALRFGAGGRLTAKGSFTGSGMLFTASNVSTGWAGLRWAAGSSGGLNGLSVVERVAGGCAAPYCFGGGAGASIHVEGTTAQPSSPVFAGVTVRDPVVSTYVHGLRATGVGATPLATNLTVQDMTGSGVYALGGAKPELRSQSVVLQRNTESAVLSTGSGTNIYLSSVLVGSVLRGPQITNGKAAGVSATSLGLVTFSSPTGGLGFANLFQNDGRGLYASGNADLYAGTFASRSRNRIVDNGGTMTTGNGLATGTGSTVAARCNWWGTATPAAFRIGTTAGGYFDAGTFLLGDPYTNPNVSCVDIFGNEEGLTAGGTAGARSGALASGRSAGADAGTMAGFGDGDTPADRLAAAFDLPPAEALAVLVALVADVPGTPEAAAALSFAGVLSMGDETPLAVVSGALALLTEQAASGALQEAAHGALVGVRLSAGDHAGALASSAALVAMGGAAERTGYAAEVFVRSTAGETAAALAALASLESMWAGSDEALAAREHLTALGVEVPGGGRAPETISPEEATLSAAEAGKTGEAAEPSLAVRPNPSAAGAPGVVTLTLAEASDVRVAVYDLLGREVAVVLDGALGAGEHTAALASSALSPGVYVVRAQAAGRVVATARLTVVR